MTILDAKPTSVTYTNDKGVLVSRVHEWWEHEVFVDDDDEPGGGYYEDYDDIDAPYYPDIAGSDDYLEMARIVGKAFNRDALRILHVMHTESDKNVQWWIIRSPDSGCGMGCHLRQYIGWPVAVARVDRGRSWWVTHVCVDEDEQHKGLGTLLMECIVDAARKDGITDDRIMLHAEPEVVPFYEKMGWVQFPSKGERMFGISPTARNMRRGHPAQEA